MARNGAVCATTTSLERETRLAGWGGRTRTAESVGKTCHCNVAQIPSNLSANRAPETFAREPRLGALQLGSITVLGLGSSTR
jgi:hypothetical protein